MVLISYTVTFAYLWLLKEEKAYRIFVGKPIEKVHLEDQE
jgi:hypothetical protein